MNIKIFKRLVWGGIFVGSCTGLIQGIFYLEKHYPAHIPLEYLFYFIFGGGIIGFFLCPFWYVLLKIIQKKQS